MNAPGSHHSNRWIVLAIVGLAQLMVVLDATIVSIALPTAQHALHFSDDSRQWVVTAYALAFGSLLLLGGRLGDLFGRKNMFVVGLIGFAVASAIGGAANSLELLVAARAGQGVFAALLAPAALAILSITFTDAAERGKAFAIYGAIAGAGAGIGLLLGGALTEWMSWRWCLYVNLLFAIPAAVAAILVIRRDARHFHAADATSSRGIDIPGTLTSALGLFALVFGFSSAETRGWGDTTTVIALVAAPVLLIAFVLIERRVASPLLPLHVVTDATRGGSYLAIGIFGVSMFGMMLFLTYFLQQNLGLSPVKAGLAFMPLNIAIMVMSGIASTVLLDRFGPRALLSTAFVLGALGMASLAQLDLDSSYWGVLPGLILVGLCGGIIFTTTFATGTVGVSESDVGVASATLNTAQQVGGSIGTALLSTLFANAVSGYLTDHPTQVDAAARASISGYEMVFWCATAVSVVGAVATFVLMRSSTEKLAASTSGPAVGVH